MSFLADLAGLRDKVMLVVGGGLGIGESCCLQLARAGCRVALLDIDEARAAGVAERVRAEGAETHTIVADALDPDNAAAILRQVVDRFGRIDGMVTVIGMAAFEPTLAMTPETWDRDMSRNLRYAFFLAQRFAIEQRSSGNGGSIVFVGSVSGLQASLQHVAYGAAKAGLVNLTKTLACEWASLGIRVNLVSPGGVNTPRIMAARPEGTGDGAQTPVPLGRRASTDEIAGCVLFLLSDLSSYVTGHNLLADGGWMAANVVLPMSVVSS